MLVDPKGEDTLLKQQERMQKTQEQYLKLE